MKYWIQDREAGNKIDCFGTIEEAKSVLHRYESEDKADGIYTEDFYEIVDDDGNIIELLV